MRSNVLICTASSEPLRSMMSGKLNYFTIHGNLALIEPPDGKCMGLVAREGIDKRGGGGGVGVGKRFILKKLFFNSHGNVIIPLCSTGTIINFMYRRPIL